MSKVSREQNFLVSFVGDRNLFISTAQALTLGINNSKHPWTLWQFKVIDSCVMQIVIGFWLLFLVTLSTQKSTYFDYLIDKDLSQSILSCFSTLFLVFFKLYFYNISNQTISLLACYHRNCNLFNIKIQIYWLFSYFHYSHSLTQMCAIPIQF